ncbi:GDYXXLXY domain-containing protein [Rhizobium calliandrae]|uniref:GDYXXLXY domain-containing protein n=1 Tax=Rhizobium calliandrae TaxID=1312182 RepID=A0ABT7KEN3_9HYPH|nr:GDYXXLXY domain-containing protein [Rhizobium calliandrae]MDL2406652.1 GDYXXLXY domain-containing protein [Rhizobium calliandrae]
MTITGDVSSVARNFSRRMWVAAIVVAALQTAVLGYMVGERAWGLRSGVEVLLKTAPIDPRDLLRGDYVTLNYDISRIPVSTLVGGAPTENRKNQVLSVRLKKEDDGYWGVVESSFGTLEAKSDTVVLKSLPFDYFSYGDSGPSPQETISVTYGIERYYVPEGEGRDVEDARNHDRVAIAARVSADGEAHIRSLLLDGKSVYEEPLY